jgi:chemotaxis protein MotB
MSSAGPGQSGIKKMKTEKTEALWLTSFCDLSLILMSFFALLLSMSTMNVKQADKVMDNMKTSAKSGPPKQNLETIYAQIKKEIKNKKLDDAVNVTLDENGLAIEFKNTLMFSSGSTDINREFSKVTNSILDIIAASPPKYAITVEGHTDDIKVGSGAKYKSNWELSALRSVAIVDELKHRTVPAERMKISAYADTRPKVSYKDKKGKQLEDARAANRRVVIKLD